MSYGLSYIIIDKYKVTCQLTQPLHIGNGDRSETVLVRVSDGVPFAQGAGIAGAFREFYRHRHPDGLLFGEKKKEKASEILKETDSGKKSGDNSTAADDTVEDESSRIRVTDGIFKKNTIVLEKRPHVRLDGKTGTVSEQKIVGTDNKSGQKFEREYIGAGACMEFCLYVYRQSVNDGVPSIIGEILKGIDEEQIQFGGKKSIGCGTAKVKDAMYIRFDMTTSEGRKLWMREDGLEEKYYKKFIFSKFDFARREAFKITVKGRTEGSLLVKSISVPEYYDGSPDSVNIQNANGDYIVPGSSFKGSIRSQMKKISGYLEKKGQITNAEKIMTCIFGRDASINNTGSRGILIFKDAVVGTKKMNDEADISHRIHIDKFTGGVIDGAKFSERNISGEVTFRISILNCAYSALACGLLVLALRDLAIGRVSLGGGASIGKGFITVDSIIISDFRYDPEMPREHSEMPREACIDMESKNIKDSEGIISECMKALAEGGSS